MKLGCRGLGAHSRASLWLSSPPLPAPSAFVYFPVLIGFLGLVTQSRFNPLLIGISCPTAGLLVDP